MKYKGIGTEQVERALHAIFDDIRTLRMDADTTRHKGAHERLLQQFRTGKADVLVGTQMIAKGLHFPQVTLVGVLNCDGSLNLPDFRASESVFQLITQVAGRAGRGELPGEVVIQSFIPDNATIQLASQQNYIKFYEDEIQVRELFAYPPFAHLAKFSFSGEILEQVQSNAIAFRSYLISQLPDAYEILPAIPAGRSKVKDRYRYQFLVKGPSIYRLSDAIQTVRGRWRMHASVRLVIDIDPLNTHF
jgi:primosomal protein N' (replication factor Y)